MLPTSVTPVDIRRFVRAWKSSHVHEDDSSLVAQVRLVWLLLFPYILDVRPKAPTLQD